MRPANAAAVCQQRTTTSNCQVLKQNGSINIGQREKAPAMTDLLQYMLASRRCSKDASYAQKDPAVLCCRMQPLVKS